MGVGLVYCDNTMLFFIISPNSISSNWGWEKGRGGGVWVWGNGGVWVCMKGGRVSVCVMGGSGVCVVVVVCVC